MSLRDAFETAARAIFDVVDSVCEEVTFKAITMGAYNPQTGVVAETEETVTGVKVVVTENYSKDLIGDHVDKTRAIVLFLTESLPGITPVVGNTITLDGTERTIIDVKTDPAKILWEVGLS